jgi:hypothetical protein
MSKSLAEKVDWLFRTHPNAHGRQYSYGQVQRATGNRVTASYVWKLRTGFMRNPGLGAAEALARFFDVPLGYFAEGGEYLEASLLVVQTLQSEKAPRDEALDYLSKNASTLPDHALRSVIDVVEYLKLTENPDTES